MKEAEVGGDGGLGGGADGGERREGGERGRRLGEDGRRGEGRRPEAVEAGSGGLGLEGRERRRRRSGGPRGWDAGELLDHVAEVVLVDVVDRGQLLGRGRRGGGGRRRRRGRIRWFAEGKRWLCDSEGALVELLEEVVSFAGGGIGRSRFVHGGRHQEIGRRREGFFLLQWRLGGKGKGPVKGSVVKTLESDEWRTRGGAKASKVFCSF